MSNNDSKGIQNQYDFNPNNWELNEYDRLVDKADDVLKVDDVIDNNFDIDASSDSAYKKRKSGVKLVSIIVIIVVVLALAGAIFFFIRNGFIMPDSSSNDSSLGTKFVCGDYAEYTIDYMPNSDGEYVKTLEIDGSGELSDYAFSEYNDTFADIEQIIVGGNVTTVKENQFSSFYNVKEIHFCSNVTYIGKDACYGLSSLEKVFVDNSYCEIDFGYDNYVWQTLGNTGQNINIICYENSTADYYANDWNDISPDSYILYYY